jgi:hypothetical protein
MVLSHDPLKYTRDWYESSQSLLYGGVSDYENVEKAVRESLFTLIRETFLIGICWLTQMYTFLTDHFARHVKSALLKTKFAHLEHHIKFLSLVDLEYHRVTRKFIHNAVVAVKHARYAKMAYAAHNILDTLKNLVGSVPQVITTIRDNGENDDGDNIGLGETALQYVSDVASKVLNGQNPILAAGSSLTTLVSSHRNPLKLIYGTGKFLTSNRNPQTANYLPQTRDTVLQLYTSVRGQLLHDITTNFFANVVLEIQQYKSISIENALQNRINRMSDKDIAHMANINIDGCRDKVITILDKLKNLEEARDDIADAIGRINNDNVGSRTQDENNEYDDDDDTKKRIRATHERTRGKRLRDIQKKLNSNQRFKNKRKYGTAARSDNRQLSASTTNDHRDALIDSETDDEGNGGMSAVEDEEELMTYDDKTSSQTYLLGVFQKHDKEDLELGFLPGDSLEADKKVVEEAQQQQQNIMSTTTESFPRLTEQSLYGLSCLSHRSPTTSSKYERDLSVASSDDEDDQNSVVETDANKQEGLFFLIYDRSVSERPMF